MSLNGILSRFKKVFHITPITLKIDLSSNRSYLRRLAIYLLLTYSFEKKEKIALEFQIGLNELEQFQNIDIDLKNDIETFFKYFKNDYLLERKSNLAFQEEISLNLTDEVLDKILLDLASVDDQITVLCAEEINKFVHGHDMNVFSNSSLSELKGIFRVSLNSETGTDIFCRKSLKFICCFNPFG